MVTRNTTRRNRHRAAIARDRSPCHWCGIELIYDPNPDDPDWHLHPQSFTIDHVIPLARGGEEELHNLVAACRACNREKSDKLTAPATADGGDGLYVTSRTWTP
ncbi:HNH endonuclease [Mycolicibacterium litorale]|uniref:HNH endonuclease n=1 Tax=Mycolicibacterium litorale TaxID=758802 RepID=UPI003CF952A2